MGNTQTINNLTFGGRVIYLDFIKCIGIICVIYGHVELFGFGLSKM